MFKRPFLIFIAIIGLLVAGVVGFIQSPRFAVLLRRTAIRYLPKDLGVEAEFSDLAIQFLPPGVSVRNPRVQVGARNALGLPEGTRVSAERIELAFAPVQMFSGNIRIHRVRVVRGELDMSLDAAAGKPEKKAGKLSLHWNDLLQVRADAFALEDTTVHLKWKKSGAEAHLMAESADIAPWSEVGAGPGYQLRVALRDIRASAPRGVQFPVSSIERFRALLRINSEGLRFEELELNEPGVRFRLTGQIIGDLLDPKGLPFDASATVDGDLARFREWLAPVGRVPLSGQASFHGRVRGNLDRLAQTISAEGALTVKGLKAGALEAEHFETQGSWSGAGGGELLVSKAVLSSPELPRSGTAQPGRGGRVTLGAFRFRPGSNEPIQVTAQLERAHLHWLAAPVLRDVWSMDVRVSGKVQGTWQPGRGKGQWVARTQVDLQVPGFRLDNQKLGVPRPLHRILDIPQLALQGGMVIDSHALHPDGFFVVAGRNRLAASGKIDFETGWDLKASGPAALQDLGQLAERDVRGEGSLALHVHGRPERVVLDFDAELKDAAYLQLTFGDFKGRITYDDGPSNLLFKGIQARQGKTPYSVEGLIALEDPDSINLRARFLPGRVEDLNRIFGDLTSKVSWFPRTLVGGVSGTMNVSGGLSLDRLKVQAELAGKNWGWVGERFNDVTLVGGYDSGRYYLDQFRATKATGILDGRISFGPQPWFDWELRSQNLQASDFDHVASLDVPVRGSFSVVSRGKGREGALESTTRLALSALSIRGVAYPGSELVISSKDGRLEAKGNAFGGQGTLDLNWDFKPGGKGALKAEVGALDFAPAILLLNPRLIQDDKLEGFITGKVDLRFPTSDPERLSGTLELEDYLLGKTGTRFTLKQPLRMTVDRGSFDLPGLVLVGGSGESRLKLHADDGNLAGVVDGKLDASISEFFTASVLQASGAGVLDYRLGGRLGSPTIEGRTQLADVMLRVSGVESPFENVSGTISLRQNRISVDDVEGDLAGGRVSANGAIEVFPDRYPLLQLGGNVQGSRLKVFPFQFVKLRGKATVKGTEPPYAVDGNFLVESALSREKVLNQNQGPTLKAARYTPAGGVGREGDFPKFKLDIEVRGDQGILVQNDLFDAELKAQVRVVNTIEAPRLLGTAEVVQGRMSFKDRTFTIQSAQVQFDNPAVINPAFNMTSTTEVGGTKVQLYASGRMDNYKIDLSSSPVLPESEILSLLALGVTTDEVRKLRSGDRSAYEQGEAASLLLHSLDFNRDVQNKTGFQIQLDEAVTTQPGTSVFRPRTDTEGTTSPKIVIKRRIGKKVDVSVGSTVGVGTSSQKQVNLEYHVTPGFSINGVWDSQEGLATKEPQTSYGVDLKVQKRFK